MMHHMRRARRARSIIRFALRAGPAKGDNVRK
jgi:hypothetical protein